MLPDPSHLKSMSVLTTVANVMYEQLCEPRNARYNKKTLQIVTTSVLEKQVGRSAKTSQAPDQCRALVVQPEQLSSTTRKPAAAEVF